MNACDILIKRGVTRLCHFTKFQSLTHIICSANGILSRESIRQDIKNVVDEARYDGELDYICCSVQYPNSWFLDIAMNRNTDKLFEDWVVMYIDLDILRYRDAKFCPGNASKNNGAYINNHMEKIDEIFADKVPTFSYSRTKQMPRFCPTDGQAEILIKDNIPRKCIIGIAVGSEDVAKRVYAMLKINNRSEIPIYIAPNVLTTEWSKMIRNGYMPNETQCNWSEEE